MLGNQLHGRTIVLGASLDEIPHSIDEETLAFNIARIGSTVTVQVLCTGTSRDE
jgi:hypothetical protein